MSSVLGLILFLVRKTFFDVRFASKLAAYLVGQPDLEGEMNEICMRESHCQPVGIHDGDRKYAKTMYDNATRVGWLNPATCHQHASDDRYYGVRGPYGASAAYTLWHLHGCYHPRILDVPIISALAVARRMQYQCKRYGACDKESRHKLWRGINKK